MCQAFCWPHRINLPGVVTNVTFHTRRLRLREVHRSLSRARADGGQPGPPDSRAGEAQLDHPPGDAEVMGAGEHDGGVEDRHGPGLSGCSRFLPCPTQHTVLYLSLLTFLVCSFSALVHGMRVCSGSQLRHSSTR